MEYPVWVSGALFKSKEGVEWETDSRIVLIDYGEEWAECESEDDNSLIERLSSLWYVLELWVLTEMMILQIQEVEISFLRNVVELFLGERASDKELVHWEGA